jgi:AraC-like DNA-binding protein
VGLDRLAAVAGCSPTHFSRAFKQSTGLAPFQWLLQKRIDRAQSLLLGARHSLAEIALATGFSSQAHFTTAFRRVTGHTPGHWRRQHRP